MIQIALTVVLLVTVWRHSHWSVALCLTLLTVSGELFAWSGYRGIK